MERDNIRAIKINCGFSKRWLPLTLCSNALNTIFPYFSIILTSILLDEIFNGIPSVYRFGILVGVLLTGNLLISVLSQLLRNKKAEADETMDYNEQRFLGSKYMRCEFPTVESEKFYKLQRTIEENQRLNGAGRNLLLRSFQGLISGFFTLFLALYLFTELLVKIFKHGFDPIVLVFIFFIIVFSVSNIMISKYRQNKELYMSGVIGDMMTDEGRYDEAIDSYQIGKDVRLYGLETLIMEFKKKYLLDDHIKHFKWLLSKLFIYTVPEVISSFLLKLTLYLFIIYYVSQGILTVGSIIKYVGFVELFIGAIRAIVLNASEIKDNTPYVAEYLKQFDLPEENQTGDCALEQEGGLCWDFEDVSFRYDGSETWALRHVSLQLSDKTCYAIVGENGSGKTTLIKLLCRLYPPTEGRILLNGRDIREYDYKEYISIISTVFQDFRLFSFTLGENIALSAQYDEVRAADCIKKVNLYDRFSGLPLGMDTPLFKDFEASGVEISGGEGQKIAIARALYKNTGLIILDEPTAALDPRSESEIYTMVSRIITDRTAIFISHRLSACKLCKKIFVLHHGELIEAGEHDMLISQKGKYSELWNAQAQFYV